MCYSDFCCCDNKILKGNSLRQRIFFWLLGLSSDQASVLAPLFQHFQSCTEEEHHGRSGSAVTSFSLHNSQGAERDS